jgi:hypothetical protein
VFRYLRKFRRPQPRAIPERFDMPSHYDIERQQKLLSMYRGLLAEYLRQKQHWERAEVPEFLSTGIQVLRGHILDTKGTLRGWRIETSDHPDDQGPDNDIGREVQHQRKLLKIYRRNLATYVLQRAQLAPDQASPSLVNSIINTRAEIQRIKAILRGFGAAVDDTPEEEIE